MKSDTTTNDKSTVGRARRKAPLTAAGPTIDPAIVGRWQTAQQRLDGFHASMEQTRDHLTGVVEDLEKALVIQSLLLSADNIADDGTFYGDTKAMEDLRLLLVESHTMIGKCVRGWDLVELTKAAILACDVAAKGAAK